MLSNWVANVRKAGLAANMLVGALDPQLAEICEKEGVPVEALDGQKAGMTNGAYLTKSQDDLRKYKLMASLKIGFALDLLKRQVCGVNRTSRVWHGATGNGGVSSSPPRNPFSHQTNHRTRQ
jgi:hypothetical protein